MTFGVSELSRAGVLEFCAPYDGVLVAEETPPSLADHTAPYEVLEGCVHEYPLKNVMGEKRHDVNHFYDERLPRPQEMGAPFHRATPYSAAAKSAQTG